MPLNRNLNQQQTPNFNCFDMAINDLKKKKLMTNEDNINEINIENVF